MDRIRILAGLLPNGFRLTREQSTSVTVLGPGDVLTSPRSSSRFKSTSTRLAYPDGAI
jgi:hypothetical protein